MSTSQDQEIPDTIPVDIEEFHLLVSIEKNHTSNEYDEDPLSELELELENDHGVLDVADIDDNNMSAEERHKEHIRRKKSDKIYNNTYNTGDGYGSEEHEYKSNIRISPAHRESHLHDPDKYRDFLDRSLTHEDILTYIESSDDIQKIITSDPSKKKFTKLEINFIFSKIKTALEKGVNKSSFVSYIQILEAISNITTLEYKKLFDLLEYDFKVCLLLELNDTYKILDHGNKTKKLF